MEQAIIQDQIKKHESFYYFIKNSFAVGLEKSGLSGIDEETGKPKLFIDGPFIEDISSFLEENPWTIRVGPRDHFKSVSFYAHFCWFLFKNKNVNLDNYYFSYKASLAGEHISNIKKIVKCIPDFKKLVDKKPIADSVAAYTWDGEHELTLDPAGLLEFKRGLHPKGVMYVDDPLRDPTNKLDPLVIKKINETFKKELIPMPHGEFHVCGTAQTNDDFFFDDTLMLKDGEEFTADNKKFARLIQPAIISYKKKIVLFPEFRSWNWLMNKLDLLKDKLFNQEYMCSPAYDEDSYFSREQILAVVNPKLKSINISSKHETKRDRVGGYDIGRKNHPAHFSAYEVIEGRKRIFRQIHQKFFDNIDYIEQIEYLTEAIESLMMDVVHYDATRGELDALQEQGSLPDEMNPVIFNRKTKNAMATVLYKKVVSKEIELIEDQRQINQILAVNNDLQAMETSEGHGDSFWSNALAFTDEIATEPNMS